MENFIHHTLRAMWQKVLLKVTFKERDFREFESLEYKSIEIL